MTLRTTSKPTTTTTTTTRPTVILELGSSYIRIGFSSESTPRHILPSILPLSSITTLHPLQNPSWESILSPLLESLLINNLLLSNPKQRRVIVILPNILPSRKFQHAILEILFRQMGVMSVLFTTSCFSSLYASGLKCGMVVDVGRREGRCCACFDGRLIPNTWNGERLEESAVPAGHENVIESFQQKLYESTSLKVSIRDAFQLVSQALETYDPSSPNDDDDDNDDLAAKTITSRIPSSQSQTITFSLQLVVSSLEEIYFDFTNPDALVYALLSTLLQIPIDLRYQLSRQCVIIGGGFMTHPSISDLFVKSLQRAVRTMPKFKCLETIIKQFRFRDNIPFAKHLLSWMGGSIMGTMELKEEKWIWKKDWVEEGCEEVRYDWTSIA